MTLKRTRLPVTILTGFLGAGKAMFRQRATGRRMGPPQTLGITRPCGVGKTSRARALGRKACRDGRPIICHRLPRLLADLEPARGDGRVPWLEMATGIRR